MKFQKRINLIIPAAMIAALLPLSSISAQSLDNRVDRLERRISQLTELMLQVETLKRENSQLRGQIELQSHTIEDLKRRQRDLYIDIDQRLTNMQQGGSVSTGSASSGPTSSEPSSSGPAASGPVGAPASSAAADQSSQSTSPSQQVTTSYSPVQQATSITSEAQKDYDKAYKLLVSPEKRYADASKAFGEFLKKHPQSPLADNAQYWLAEANYVLQQNNTALAEFDKLIKQYPTSPKVPGALLKSGYIYHSTGETTQAKKMLNQVMAQFPGSAEASLAKKRLQRIASGN